MSDAKDGRVAGAVKAEVEAKEVSSGRLDEAEISPELIEATRAWVEATKKAVQNVADQLRPVSPIMSPEFSKRWPGMKIAFGQMDALRNSKNPEHKEMLADLSQLRGAEAELRLFRWFPYPKNPGRKTGSGYLEYDLALLAEFVDAHGRQPNFEECLTLADRAIADGKRNVGADRESVATRIHRRQ